MAQATDRARARIQKGIVIVPSAFTLANLCLGVLAVVEASKGNFDRAGWMIVWAAVCDALDGRVARFTRTGSRFGAELDSLVDAISFGLAPAMIIYFEFLSDGHWAWLVAYAYVVCAVIRLARFNIEQSGQAKKAFHGLPSPTAAMTLATFHTFAGTAFYQSYLGGLPGNGLIGLGVIVVAVLMLSHVLYPVIPSAGVRSLKEAASLVFLVTMAVLAIGWPRYFFFPACIGYIAWGFVRVVLIGLGNRIPEDDPLDDEDGREEDGRPLEYSGMRPRRRSRRRQP